MDMRLFGGAFGQLPPPPPSKTHHPAVEPFSRSVRLKGVSMANQRRREVAQQTQRLMADFILANGPVNRRQIGAKFPNLSTATTYNYLSALVDDGIVVRGGANPGPGVWAAPGALMPQSLVRKEHLVRESALIQLMFDGNWHTVWSLSDRMIDPVHRSNIVRTLVRMERKKLVEGRREGRGRAEWRLTERAKR